MADLVITATSVVGSLPSAQTNLAGATITAGQAIYIDSSDKVQVLDANSLPASNKGIGVALNGGAINQPISWQAGGDITIGAATTTGTMYIVSATNPGGFIAPDADRASGWTVIQLGRAKSTTVITLDVKNTGIVV